MYNKLCDSAQGVGFLEPNFLNLGFLVPLWVLINELHVSALSDPRTQCSKNAGGLRTQLSVFSERGLCSQNAVF